LQGESSRALLSFERLLGTCAPPSVAEDHQARPASSWIGLRVSDGVFAPSLAISMVWLANPMTLPSRKDALHRICHHGAGVFIDDGKDLREWASFGPPSPASRWPLGTRFMCLTPPAASVVMTASRCC